LFPKQGLTQPAEFSSFDFVRMAGWRACVVWTALLASAWGAPAQDLSLGGWRMWPDTNAAWQNDTLYLPSQVVLSSLPVNPPTGGWAALSSSSGIPVTLPGSVEQYYWAAFGGGALNGNYHGVSWWWRAFTAPTLQPGQRLIINFRAARLRAEVYCNGKLCGYNLINEVPFEADVTGAVAQGAATNELAVRITSPGGNLDWVDWGDIAWGNSEVPLSRGICGLDADIILQVRDPVSVSDLAVLNRPNPQEVWLVGTVTNTGATTYSGPVTFDIQDSNSVAVWQTTNTLSVPGGGQAGFTNVVVLSKATLWDLTNPVLYKADAAIPGNGASGMSVNFGFRWFAAEGIGSNALLRLNGRRIVLRSAISWGWWAPNGLFPSDDMARKEVTDAQALGLNCLQFHRNVGHPNVLDQQDQLGLLRYEEPGNGQAIFGPNFSSAVVVPTDLSGNGGLPLTFDQQYEAEKILRMVRRDRSHPSLVVYCIQNEVNPCLTNAYIWWLFQRIREIDPSRTVVLHSGVGANNEVMMPPYSTNFLYENGSGYSGWSDQHTVGGPGNYQDGLYVSANNYSHYSSNSNEIAMWGEMLGVGTPDDHEAIVEWYQTNGMTSTGYDLQLHQQVLTAYNSFLDQWNFRSSFPTASSLFQAIGTKSYFFWQKLMENGRMSDNNDYLVISGWESTLGENHSGLVDSRRNFKADPSILKKAMAPEVLVIRPKRFVLKPGDTANVDVHLINETGRAGAQSLTITAHNPDGSVLFSQQRTVTATGGDVYGQVLATNLTFIAQTNGTVRIDGLLQPSGGSGDVLTNEEQLLVVDPLAGAPVMSNVVVFESGSQITSTLTNVFGVKPLSSDQLTNSLDAVVIGAGGTSSWSYQSYNVTDAINGTSDPGLFQKQMFGKSGTVGTWSGFAPGNITVQLYFAETYWSATNMRVFDVAINGATVLTNFDIFQQAGGRDIALVKTFTVSSGNGAITLSFPNVAVDNAQIAAFKITDASNKVLAVVFSASSFTDLNGLVWQPLAAALGSMLPLTDGQWETTLNQVYSNGVRLVAWPNGVNEAMTFATKLAASNIVAIVNWNGNNGFLGQANAPWLGSWYFARQHWLLDGLPVNSVLGWQYQVPHQGTDVGALLIDSTPTCPMDVMIGYGRDHEARVGVGCAVIQYGKGLIILPSLPGLRSALTATGGEITQPVAQRLLGNSLRAVPASSPEPPTGVTAINGNGQVIINWNPAFGGTEYNVKRSNVSGGPYTLIISNLAALTWTDAGLANGSNYYYVVSAANAIGESSNSVRANSRNSPNP
jgi:beta-galactosidase